MSEETAPTIAATGYAPASGTSAVPTTKVLAIGRWTEQGTPSARLPILPTEMRETARLYLAGKIDQWFFKADESGVVLIMNLTDPLEAHELLEQLPLGRAGMMEFELIPLGPLKPLGLLLGKTA